MFPKYRSRLAALFAAALIAHFSVGVAQAQHLHRPTGLAALQQQNAWQQQQNAVQAAVQQTNLLLQTTDSAPAPLNPQNNAPPQAGMPTLLALEQQESALQVALQQTTGLLQVSYRRNSALSQVALQQLNTIQVAQQQTMSLEAALSRQNSQLTVSQLFTLSQEQASLTALLTSQPAPPGRTSRR